MQAVASHRCAHHPAREAVARCPECGGFFCIECVVEHDGRVLCAACLGRIGKASLSRPGWLRRSARLGVTVASALLLWLFFQLVGLALVRIPTDFHEGTLWKRALGASDL